MARKPKITEERLKAILSAEVNRAVGYVGGEISEQRAEALEYYDGDPDAGPLTNRQEGRSSVVSTDVRDTVEWVLPSLLRVFTAGDQVVEFDPQGEEDIPQAEQETDYVNHAILKDNPGFLIFYTWMKDALIQKNGYVKCWWDETEEETREEYEGLTEIELAMLDQHQDVDITEHSQRQLDFMGQPIAVHDVAVRRTNTRGRLKIENIPPEEFLISPRARSIEDAPMVGTRTKKTPSDLLQMGVDQATIDRLPSYNEPEYNEERTRRFNKDEEWPEQHSEIHDSMREIWIYECFLHIDYDGDGINELRKITWGGNNVDVILFNDVVDKIDIYDITPIPMPHKHFGKSLADLVSDLQVLKSVLWRQYLDNLYNVNNVGYEVPEGAQGDNTIEDLLTSRPNRIVRTAAPGLLKALDTPMLGPWALQMMDFAQSEIEKRTGVTKYNQGLDADTLNDTASGIAKIQAAANQRIELIARIFAETGFKSLFLAAHRLIRQNQDQERILQLRNQWVAVDPSQWKDRMDLTVNVGLGMGNKDQMLLHLQMIHQHQMEMIQVQGGMNGPLVTPTHLYKTYEAIVNNADLKQPHLYFMDPESPRARQQGQQQQPDPAQLMMQLEMQKLQIQQQFEQAKLRAEQEMKQMELQAEDARKRAEMALEDRRKRDEMDMEDDRERREMAMDHAIDLREVGLKSEIARRQANA